MISVHKEIDVCHEWLCGWMSQVKSIYLKLLSWQLTQSILSYFIFVNYRKITSCPCLRPPVQKNSRFNDGTLSRQPPLDASSRERSSTNLDSSPVELNPHDELLLPELAGQLRNIAPAVESLVLGQVLSQLDLLETQGVRFNDLIGTSMRKGETYILVV